MAQGFGQSPIESRTWADNAALGAPYNSTCRYHGFSLRNTDAANSATVRLRSGTSAGVILDTVQLNPAESAREYYPDAIRANGGIYCQLVAGAVEGVVRVG